MYQAAVTEFPFVEALPKREKSKLSKLWDELKEVKRLADEKGVIVPQHMAAGLLGLSKQRIGQLIDDGRLEGILIHGTRFVTENSIREFAGTERKAGRPPKIATNKELWRLSLDTCRQVRVEKT